MSTLRMVIPNGSLSEPLGRYLGVAGYPVGKPDRTGFCGEANGIAFFQLDRRMVPSFVASGVFDAGITGYDLWIASGAKGLKSVAELCFSRATNQPTRWVLARRKGKRIPRGSTVRVACELPVLGRALLKRTCLPWRCRFVRVDGSEEQSVSCGLADLVLVVTETGKSLEANGLTIVPGCEKLLTSTPRVLVRRDLRTPQEDALTGLSLALQAVVGAQAYVMVAFDLPAAVDISALSLPSSVAPTVCSLLPPSTWKACDICIPRTEFGPLLPRLKSAGARAIVLREVQGYLP